MNTIWVIAIQPHWMIILPKQMFMHPRLVLKAQPFHRIQGSSGSTTLHDDKVSLMFYGYQVLPLIKGQSMRAN